MSDDMEARLAGVKAQVERVQAKCNKLGQLKAQKTKLATDLGSLHEKCRELETEVCTIDAESNKLEAEIEGDMLALEGSKAASSHAPTSASNDTITPGPAVSTSSIPSSHGTATIQQSPFQTSSPQDFDKQDTTLGTAMGSPMCTFTPQVDSATLPDSPTDSPLTAGAAQCPTPQCSGAAAAETSKDLTYGDLQDATRFHPKYPTIVSICEEKWCEYWCKFCGANVEVDENGRPSAFFDGAIGLYEHIVHEHIQQSDQTDAAVVFKYFKSRKISAGDQKLIIDGKNPANLIVMRVPYSSQDMSQEAQASKRTSDNREGPGVADAELPASKRPRTAAVAGIQNRKAIQKKYPFRNNGSATKKKPATSKMPTDTEPTQISSPTCTVTPTTHKDTITRRPRTSRIIQYRPFPEALDELLNSPGTDHDDEEDLPVGKMSQTGTISASGEEDA